MTVNSDLIYDVLLRHQPDHVLIRATRDDAARGLTDIRRLADLLARFDGKTIRKLDRISDGNAFNAGSWAQILSRHLAVEDGLAELEADLINEAMDGLDISTPHTGKSGAMTSAKSTSLSILLNGQDVILNGDGTALFDHGKLMVVSDLHLEKGRALSKTSPMPLYDTDATLDALEQAIARDHPEMLLFLGDSFHRSELIHSLAASYRDRINALCNNRGRDLDHWEP